jgi:hypothetical protein
MNRLAEAVPDGGGQRGHVEVTVDDRGEVGAVFGLADLEFADGP